jgi:hypothetical protein
MWESQPLANLRASTACIGITLPSFLLIVLTITSKVFNRPYELIMYLHVEFHGLSRSGHSMEEYISIKLEVRSKYIFCSSTRFCSIFCNDISLANLVYVV